MVIFGGPDSICQEISLSETVGSPITVSCFVMWAEGFQLKALLKGNGINKEYSSGEITESSIGYFAKVSLTIDSIPEGISSCEIRLIKKSGYCAVVVDNVVCELETEQEISTKYIYAGNRLLAKDDNGELFFYHLDRLGSPIMITDESGNVVKEKQYEAFGNIVWEEGTYEDNREFTSKEKDPTGFHYFGARYYYGNIGRFLSPDPHTVSPGNIDLSNPQELNPYVYCYNNPVNYFDPDGLYAFRPTDDKIVGGMMRTAFRHSGIARSLMLGAKKNSKIIVNFKLNDQLNDRAITYTKEGWKNGMLIITVEFNWKEIGTNPKDHTEVVAHELTHVEELSETENNEGIKKYKENEAKSGCTKRAKDTGGKARGQYDDKSNKQYENKKDEELNDLMFSN